MVGEPFTVPVAGGGHRIHNAAFDWFDILAALGSLAPLSTGRPQPLGYTPAAASGPTRPRWRLVTDVRSDCWPSATVLY